MRLVSFRAKAKPARGSEDRSIHEDEGQAKKGAGRMPWHQEPMKDVTSCEKPRGGANIH